MQLGHRFLPKLAFHDPKKVEPDVTRFHDDVYIMYGASSLKTRVRLGVKADGPKEGRNFFLVSPPVRHRSSMAKTCLRATDHSPRRAHHRDQQGSDEISAGLRFRRPSAD